jgi:hypothetical protein
VLASLALTFTEMYNVATEVMKRAPQKTFMEDRPLVTEILRLNNVTGSVIGGKRSNTNVTQQRLTNNRPTSSNLTFKSVNVSVDAKQEDPKTWLETLANIWKLYETSTIRWVCRILAFIWAYMYHDW